MDSNRRPWAEAVRLALWAALAVPVTILVHECGHFAVGLASGLPVQLHPTSVSGGATLAESGAAMVALQAGAGPLMTVVMGLVFAHLYARNGRRFWALAAAVVAASRLLVTTGYLGIRLMLAILGRPFTGTPNFDEHNLARALGLPPLLLALAATAFLIGLCAWLIRRMPRGARLVYVLALTGGIALGATLWSILPPPVLVAIG